MNPITTLSLAHIGKRIRITDDSITLTGTLLAIDAERQTIYERNFNGEETITPGSWENITVTVGPNQINLSAQAKWEDA